MEGTPRFSSITPLIPAGEEIGESVAFYQRLGFSIVWSDGDPASMTGMNCGDVGLILYRNGDRYLADQTSFRIRVDEIEGLYEGYLAKGVAIHPNGGLQEKPWGGKEFSLIDPAGVCITFHAS